MRNELSLIFHNQILLTGAAAWGISQILKLIIYRIVNGKLVWERLHGDGGMPSSHSATVTSIALASGMQAGWDSPVFAVAFFLAVIVMHDAMGVRLETGKQAKAINDMMVFIQEISEGQLTPEQTLKEFVGHTPLQVFVGCGLGIIVGILMNL